MLRRLRAVWRAARAFPPLRPVITAVDRLWWAHTIARAKVVDIDYVVAQGLPRTRRRAVRAYVRGAYRQGFSMNPLFHEQLVSSQLQEAGRVPPLYAYLVNDVRTVETSTSWDAPSYAKREPASLTAPGGPLGHAWRAARSGAGLEIGRGQHSRVVMWGQIIGVATQAIWRARGIDRDADIPVLNGSILLLCRLGRREPASAATLNTIIALVADSDTDAVIAIATPAPDVWTAASLLSLWLPRVTVRAEHPRLIETIESRSPQGHVLLVRGAHAIVSAEDLMALASAATSGPVGPLWLDMDGAVAAAGYIAHAGRTFPFLSGHPAEDAHALGERIETAGVAGETFARPVGAADFATALTLLDRVVRAPAIGYTPPRRHAVDSDVDTLISPLGMRVAEWNATGPRFERTPGHHPLSDGTVVPRLRWAIKIAAPPGDSGEAWGDTHFARGLADALRRLGQEVVIDAYQARARSSRYLDDVVLALRGPEPIEPQSGVTSILWIISHPDEITDDQLLGFDMVFAASPRWAASAAERWGIPIHPLLQATDAHRFRPAGVERTGSIVFVGTARGIFRPSIVEPLRHGIPVTVYGPDWRGWIPAAAIAATGIANSELPLLYERASAVLNDHWPAMKSAGFVSNRLYDVVAAGGRVISDDVEGIAAVFGGAVLTYRAIPELLELLESDLDSLFPSPSALAGISKLIRREHSFDARARALLDAALRLGAAASRAV